MLLLPSGETQGHGDGGLRVHVSGCVRVCVLTKQSQNSLIALLCEIMKPQPLKKLSNDGGITNCK